ncbi:penicillin-binding protein [Rothia nasimurium]|uniref:Penicillin-binding protein n=1 Tax=Rothia nasimurium TaxID=85336 RepID=A0A1Y1RPI7_9MICC|nr:transglycosylase domain-containing protein [Rothia nasimurium]ORC16421.1 penicillin-binding protein [Rothia nasimurium]
MASSKNVRTRRRTPGDLVQFIALSIIAGFIAALILVPPTTALSATANASMSWFKSLPATLSNGPLSQPSVIYASDGETELASYYAQNRTEVPLDQISENMKDAILSSEDRNFYEHGAVSPMGIARALINNVINPNNRQGASTLTQQYVNNLLFDAAEQSGEEASTMGASKGYLDKIKEIKLAISVEQNMTKDEVLEGYLNVINLGGTNYGVEAAAYYYWGIKASELSVAQSALLAGMVVSPNMYRPDVNPQLAKERRDVVLGTMLRDGKITEEEYSNALNEEIELDIHTTPMGCSTAGDFAHFCYYAVTDFLNDETFGATEDDRANALYRGGYKIVTTVDTDAQEAAKEQVEATQPSDNNPDRVSASLVSVAPGSGKIIAMAQNSDYGNSEETDFAANFYNYNVGVSHGGTAGFQPGSTFKAVLLAQWIKDGKGVNATIDGTSISYPKSFPWPARCLEGGHVLSEDAEGFSFDNAEGGSRGWGTVAYGLKNSINSYAVKMASETDACDINDLRAQLRITDGMGGDPYTLSRPSYLLGGWDQGTTPLIMASAYATFASGGTYCEPLSLEKVSQGDTEVKTYQSSCERVLDEEVANGVSYVLKQVLVDGSGYQRGIGLSDASAAKTGTTNNSTQTWMVGYTRGLSTASWVGNVENTSRSLNNLSINGRTLDYVDGATYAGAQWQRFMQAQAKNFNTDKFDEPSSTVLGTGQ